MARRGSHDGPWAKWKCASRGCGWVGLRKQLKDVACPACGSEDVFPLHDGGWPGDANSPHLEGEKK